VIINKKGVVCTTLSQGLRRPTKTMIQPRPNWAHL